MERQGLQNCDIEGAGRRSGSRDYSNITRNSGSLCSHALHWRTVALARISLHKAGWTTESTWAIAIASAAHSWPQPSLENLALSSTHASVATMSCPIFGKQANRILSVRDRTGRCRCWRQHRARSEPSSEGDPHRSGDQTLPYGPTAEELSESDVRPLGPNPTLRPTSKS